MKRMMSLILCLFFMSPVVGYSQPSGKALFKDLGCANCHDANRQKKLGPFPVIKLQTAKEIEKVLAIYKAGKQRGPMSKVMSGNTNIQRLTKADMAALAKFLTK